MARDVDVDVNVHDKTKPGLDSVEKRFKDSGKKITKEYEKFGTGAGDAILKGVGAVSPKLAQKLAQGIGDSASLGAPLLISGIAAAAPVISGLLGAAVTGGAAGAGIIGGVALAARDPRVKEAGTTLGSNLLANLSTQADSFIGPVLNTIDSIGDRFSQNGEKIERIFDNSAKFVEPLGDALLDLGDNLIDGLDTAVGRAGPVMGAIDDGIRVIGDSIEGFIDNVTANASGNAEILDQTFKSVAGAITLVGQVTGGLVYVFEQLNAVMPLSLLGQLNDLFNDSAESGRRSQGGSFGAAEGVQRVGDAAETTAKDMQLYEKALEDNARAAEDAANAQRSLFDDTTKVGEATLAARESARKNGQTLDANTKKGQANRNSLSQLAGAMNQYRTNQQKAGASTATTTATLNSQRNKLVAQAIAMGASRKKANELAAALLGIPLKRDPKVTLNTSNVASEARNAREEINKIKGKSVTISVTAVVNASRLAAVERRLQRISGGNLAAADSFGQAVGGQLARVGGPSGISIDSQVAVTLDGAPLRLIAAKVDNRIRRDAFRNKVGRRR